MSRGLDRREFLVASAAVTAAVALPACGSGQDGPPDDWHDAGPLTDLDPDLFIERRLRIQVPATTVATPATAWLRAGRPPGEPPVIAFSARCTHLGCPTRYVEASRKFICPCHGGVFGFHGRPEGGPPDDRLTLWGSTVHEGRVFLAPRPGEKP